MKKFILIISTIMYLFSFSLSLAQEAKKEHPIDAWLTKCFDQDSSTVAMRECSHKAYAMWDKELNKNYQNLMKALSPEGKKLLKNAQLSWIKFRDQEFKLNDEIMGSKQGTMYLLTSDGFHLDFVSKRARDLDSHLSTLNE